MLFLMRMVKFGAILAKKWLRRQDHEYPPWSPSRPPPYPHASCLPLWPVRREVHT